MRCAHAVAPDVMYYRQSPVLPGMSWLLRNVPVVVELNGDLGHQYMRFGGVKAAYERASRTWLHRLADGYVAVTNELAERFASPESPTVVIANGAKLRATMPSAPANDRVTAVFIGSGGKPWHGLDVLIQIARALPEWRFVLVGPHGLSDRPANVEFTGPLPPGQLSDVIASADIAFGSLAMSRSGLSEACPLKVRDYLAAGVPTVVGYRDTDFPRGADFLFDARRLGEPDGPTVADLASFAERWRGRRIPREQLLHLDVADKERQRLAFFEELRSRR